MDLDKVAKGARAMQTLAGIVNDMMNPTIPRDTQAFKVPIPIFVNMIDGKLYVAPGVPPVKGASGIVSGYPIPDRVFWIPGVKDWLDSKGWPAEFRIILAYVPPSSGTPVKP